MPKIRTSRTKAPPEGFEEIEGILEDYARAMRDAENENTEGKRAKGKCYKVEVEGGFFFRKAKLTKERMSLYIEALWPIMRIAHTRSRYIYDLHYKREAISKELYEWLLKQGYADAK